MESASDRLVTYRREGALRAGARRKLPAAQNIRSIYVGDLAPGAAFNPYPGPETKPHFWSHRFIRRKQWPVLMLI